MNDSELFEELARKAGRSSVSAAVRVLRNSALRDEYKPDEISEPHWPKDWSEVDYKTYPRFQRIAFDPLVADSQSERPNSAKPRRVSCRDFFSQALELTPLINVLTEALADRADRANPSRSYPSAGGLYSTEVYLVAREVRDLERGAYHFSPNSLW